MYYFKKKDVRNLDLEVGFLVKYLAYKLSDEVPIKIFEVSEIVSESWSRDNFESDNFNREYLIKKKPHLLNTHQKIISGTVTNKVAGILTVKTGEIGFSVIDVDLDKTQLEFVPIIGDDLEMDIMVETNPSVLNFSGSPLAVISIRPAFSKPHMGTIRKQSIIQNRSYGVIDDDYIYFEDALDVSDNLEQKPTKGDVVLAQVIASHQKIVYKTYDWRCITVIKATDSKLNQHSSGSSKEAATVSISDIVDENKNGIWITGHCNLKVVFENIGDKKKIQVLIRNDLDSEQKLLEIKMVVDDDKQLENSQLCTSALNLPYIISRMGEIALEMDVVAKWHGISQEQVEFIFDKEFKITRTFEIEVITKDLLSNITTDNVAVAVNGGKIERNKFYTKNVWMRKNDFVPGVRLKQTPHFIYKKMPHFEVPDSLKHAVLDNDTLRAVDERLRDVLPSYDRIDFKNYIKCFQGLLHLEEIQLFHDFRNYDRDRAYFTRESSYLALQMENALEVRPSLIIGDHVIAYNPLTSANENGKGYRGFIHKIYKNRILLLFSPEFNSNYSGEDYRLEFGFSRSKFDKQHNAIKNVAESLGSNFLFPQKVNWDQIRPQLNIKLTDGTLKMTDYKKELPWSNEHLNVIQKKAIEGILRGEARPLPYVIFGPPGTGKTSTIVESIIQIYKHVSGSRIIVAAPSNSAANIITQRLTESRGLIHGQFVRIVSHNSIEREQVPEDLLPYCVTVDIAVPDSTKDNTIKTDSGLKLQCNSSYLQPYRIVIGTCMALGQFLCLKLPKNHYTHVIIDEAGQCLEPEAMIPISLVGGRNGQVILAGDPMQLGPIVLSRFAKDRGLEKSFLVRLLDCYPYKRDETRFEGGYDCRLVTKLLYNYRSLPSILSIYSRLFYHSELIPTVSEINSEEIKLLQYLREQKIFPSSSGGATENHGICFYGVRGKDRQVADSPSWCNPSEAGAVRV